MPTELTTPFDEEQRSKADQELVSVVLGERAAEEMSTLINQDKTKESITTAPTKLELSGDETSRIQ